MRSYYTSLLACLLLSASVHCTAQDTPGFPRLYAGIYASAGNYPIFYPRETTSYLIASKPVQVGVGYRFTPQWAIQVGYTGSRQAFHDAGGYIGSTGQAVAYDTRDTQRNTALPLLARYTVTRRTSHRLQFDALAGITVVWASYHKQGYRTENGATVFQENRANRATNAFLTVGPSLRYVLGKHLQLTGAVAVHKSLHKASASPGLGTSVSAGVQYLFGK
ncbi:outer membrane beta-barrel protein [Hymenobacter sp. 102]|uniref:outer membrane beta-barrel protein n=1 Tax=Hymenobacter sp. 102 TaxID=3403152 RepID=UPI003CEF1BAD